ncbi:unnamed protein product, partial [Brenthis ino]
MSLKVERIISDVQELGEGPHWDERQKALFFVNIKGFSIHKYVPATKQHTKTKLNGNVGFIVPVEGTTDQFIVGLEKQFVIVQWDGGDGSPASVVKELGTVDEGVEPPTRINDGKADPRGRVFAGTIGYENSPGDYVRNKASLYRVDERGIQKLCSNITISNGLNWDLRRKAFYYTDTFERKIRRYDYDVETGEISNLEYIFDFEKENVEGYPDGSTIDADGNLWVAVFNGSCVIKIDPVSGKVLDKVSVPAPQVTSVTFGGDNLDVMFVTTACMDVGGIPGPPSGSVFMVTGVGVKGTKNMNFKLK